MGRVEPDVELDGDVGVELDVVGVNVMLKGLKTKIFSSSSHKHLHLCGLSKKKYSVSLDNDI